MAVRAIRAETSLDSDSHAPILNSSFLKGAFVAAGKTLKDAVN